MSAPPRATGRRAGRRSLPRRLLRWGLVALLVCFLLGVGAFAYGYMATDIPDPNEDVETQTTFVYYANGNRELGGFAEQNRTSVPLGEVPQSVQNAVIAAEDRTFYTNQGLDPKGILRAAFNNAQGNSTQGASTITQQYVKVFYLNSDQTLTRKVKEAFLSLKLQRTQSKERILQGYLNTIYFGRGAYGIQAAAEAYFTKDVSELSVREGAALAAILNSPGSFDPAGGRDNRDALADRYRYVLDGMADLGTLTRQRAAAARSRLPDFPRQQQTDQYGGQRGHLLTLVKQQLLDLDFSETQIDSGGLRVRTTFTAKAMRAAGRAVRTERPRGLTGLHAAVASVDTRTGALRGMYAGQDYLQSQYNWAVEGGAPGSTFKPYALAAGLEDGFSLRSTFQGNSPYVFPNGDRVVNAGEGLGESFGSAITLEQATEDSVNTAYVDLTAQMDDGPQQVVDTAVDLGIPQDAPGLEPTSGVALGSATISPIDMANAYGTFADGGRAKDWFVVSRVTDADGRVLYADERESRQVLRRAVARDVTYALAETVQEGTGTAALELGRPAAGKTGTATNENGDVSSSWFVGYTPQISTAVMYVRGRGNDALNCVRPAAEVCTPGYLEPYYGGTYPAQTWTATMRGVMAGLPVQQFPPPAFVEATSEEHTPLPPEPTPEPTLEATPEPTREATPEPTLEPSPEPTLEPSPEPTAPTSTTSAPPPSPSPTPSPTRTRRPDPTPTTSQPPPPSPTSSGPRPSPTRSTALPTRTPTPTRSPGNGPSTGADNGGGRGAGGGSGNGAGGGG